MEENKTLRAIVESTDAGKAALAEVKRLTEVVRVLEERNRGLMNEKESGTRTGQDVDAQGAASREGGEGSG